MLSAATPGAPKTGAETVAAVAAALGSNRARSHASPPTRNRPAKAGCAGLGSIHCAPSRSAPPHTCGRPPTGPRTPRRLPRVSTPRAPGRSGGPRPSCLRRRCRHHHRMSRAPAGEGPGAFVGGEGGQAQQAAATSIFSTRCQTPCWRAADPRHPGPVCGAGQGPRTCGMSSAHSPVYRTTLRPPPPLLPPPPPRLRTTHSVPRPWRMPQRHSPSYLSPPRYR